MIRMKIGRSFLWPIVIFIIVAAAMVWTDGRPPLQNYAWHCLQRASCYPHCFCEAFHAGGIVQPLTSYSNLFYILAGLLILGSRGLPVPGSKNNLMIRRRGYITGFGAAVIGIGITSMFFHVSLTTLGWWLDYMGMYAFVGYCLVYGLARFRGWNGRTFALLYAVLLAALGLGWIAAPEFKRYLLAGLILAVIVVETVAHRVRRPFRIRTYYFVAALAVFLLAFAFNVLDDSVLCAPASLWQWHALWHFMTAVSAGLLYLYYRSEEE
jgi:hypothetical protein